ncbi:beta-N-acetylhexosaminidase [Actinopolyspora erythraea]|uniref:beta-N-acetylhexosaminidase n=1 Tax=Actinopolyspora erythraea TaxID=414996 RepID=A0A223RRN3_9ACTN|nr:beta-N-acetylhexosaminidase [Actinopolyspora erythraea]ASU78528.1 beta-N-acetylhexosaminidase [Actinopolyspora erythraea]
MSTSTAPPPLDSVVPRPVRVLPAPGTFTLDGNTTVSGGTAAGEWLRRHVGAATGLPLTEAEHGDIGFRLAPEEITAPEGYRIEITERGVLAEAHDESGAHYAAQTLRQLLGADAWRGSPVRRGPWPLPCGEIEDHPRFSWRGCHLDLARHFMPKREVLRFVELLAAHKLNVLHLHLTDDQGWRVEVPGLPRLTEIGAWRTGSQLGAGPDAGYVDRPHGGYYTEADLTEIVSYAAEHRITVIPEIDVPGHCQAAIASYPELGNDPRRRLEVWTGWGVSEHVLNAEESTVEFFRRVFDHVMSVFPSPVVCVGGDEVPPHEWERGPRAVRRSEALGLSEPARLHGWFLRRIIEHLHANGRRAISWDEALDSGERLPSGCIVASWRDEASGIRAAEAGYDTVMCPEQRVYLDHRQSDDPDEPIPVGFVRTLEDVYDYEPVPAESPSSVSRHVLGTQAQVWTEHLDSPSRVDYAAFPRLCAFAEVAWSRSTVRDFSRFRARLEAEHLDRLTAFGVEFRPLEGPMPWQKRPGVPGNPR